MKFKSIVYYALVIGMIAGTVYGTFQQLAVNPLIYSAEEFEVSSTPAPSEGENHSEEESHRHDHESWSPADGLPRILSTLFSNILVAIAFAMILLPAIAIHNIKSNKKPVNGLSGIGWGIGLLITVYLSPALLGLYPEIPGTITSSLENRQLWWVTCVIATGVGLAFVYYANRWLKPGGVALIMLPHILGGPKTEALRYFNTDPAAIAVLEHLTQNFIIMTSIGMVIFFVLLGGLSGIASSRYQKIR